MKNVNIILYKEKLKIPRLKISPILPNIKSPQKKYLSDRSTSPMNLSCITSPITFKVLFYFKRI